MTAGSRRVRNKYIGQSGTTIHKRQRSHLSGSKSVLKKHCEEYHKDQQSKPKFTMKVLRGSKTVLDRLVWEANLISQAEENNPGSLMNSKGEWGKNKMVRFAPQISRG